jgi:hypothetical protein
MPHIVNDIGLEASVSSIPLNALTVMNRHKSETKTKGGRYCAYAVVVSGRGFRQKFRMLGKDRGVYLSLRYTVSKIPANTYLIHP